MTSSPKTNVSMSCLVVAVSGAAVLVPGMLRAQALPFPFRHRDQRPILEHCYRAIRWRTACLRYRDGDRLALGEPSGVRGSDFHPREMGHRGGGGYPGLLYTGRLAKSG